MWSRRMKNLCDRTYFLDVRKSLKKEVSKEKGQNQLKFHFFIKMQRIKFSSPKDR